MVGAEKRSRNKRKLESLETTQGSSAELQENTAQAQKKILGHHVAVLQSCAAAELAANIAAAQTALSSLAEAAKSEAKVEDIVSLGGVEAVVPLLTAAAAQLDESARQEIERDSCIILGLLATNAEHQRHIAGLDALPAIVAMLQRYAPTQDLQPNPLAARRAADAITNLAHENVEIKEMVREANGIPPLVALLDSPDVKVQRASAGALRTLAFKCDANKNQIVGCNALPTLINMLHSEDAMIHYEAVGVIGNLVHSSKPIKRTVLEEGALQPVIALLSSPCIESQREAALLLGQFATTEPDYKANIVQRGAVPPLVAMLHSSEPQLKEMAAFALGRLAQNSDNQAGIAQSGGLPPLLALLDSDSGNLQHNAAFALYGLADNEDNMADIIREDGVRRLMNCNCLVQQSRDCVSKTLKRLEDKLKLRDPPHRRPINKLMYLMQHSHNKELRHRFATSLAVLAQDGDLKLVFLERNGLRILMDMLKDKNRETARQGAVALHELCKKVVGDPSQETAVSTPSSQTVYLGLEYVNNQTLSDVTFMVEDKPFYAHRIALLASSDAFRAMFEGPYRESKASEIPIPNIRYEVFQSMMQCIYTGTTVVTTDNAQELLAAADQYMLEKLKVLAQRNIAEELNADNVEGVYEMAVDYHAQQLMRKCILYVLEHWEEVMAEMKPREFSALVARMSPELQDWLVADLAKLTESPTAAAPPAAQPNQQHNQAA